ncbi:glycoside hydrolase family 47 protein [Aspergillus mulundensis]|uniref:alpha-1,2-Mannosidase n=1 Tax=Aspergillus mulundensis TaxID=1810919 RepID=A0A3D8S428_9EURO|nr:alpha-1,2-Mannosidase [Aspergillus mulundensis]RDW81018.1 alpha-1,2-Mannosidase [Aspergillus mulundensis]
MLLVKKRYALPTFILTFLIYLVFTTLPPGAERSYVEHHSHPIHDVTEPAKDDDRIHWTKHAEQYPISDYVSLPTTSPSPIPQIQYDFPAESWLARMWRRRKQNAVKDAFKHAWKGYKDNAWLRDELSPLSGGYRTSFAGWAATLVDSLDTLIIMGLMDEFEDALEALEHIDFSTTDSIQINVFETNIRYLGGLLGAHDLTEGKYPILIKKATEIADFLYGSFDTRNRMPQSRWDWTRSASGQTIHPSGNTILAELGSLNLEFTRMSQLTGDQKYFDAIQRITDYLESAQKDTMVPGLWPMLVDARSLRFSDPRYTVGGMADSTYEYLPKEHMLLEGRTQQYQRMYESAMPPIKERMLFRPMTKDGADVLFSGNIYAGTKANRKKVDAQAEHLKCYLGGTVGIGAKVFNRTDELTIARKLTDGCIWAYDIMPSGIMPEIMYLSPCDDAENCPWDEQKWYEDVRARPPDHANIADTDEAAQMLIEKLGLVPGVAEIADARYMLRPEAIESVFIIYRITGDTKYQDAAWRMFRNIEKATRTEYAHAAISDVRQAKPKQLDYMESFWLAETLKYFYLIFSEPDLISLDEYVLNTEAHPFRRPS